MGVNCVILGGITNIDNGYSSTVQMAAGPYRIATELRQNNFSVQVIDITYLKTFDYLFKAVIKKFVGPETLWVGVSTNFLHAILDVPWAETQKQKDIFKQNPLYGTELKKLIDYCRSINPNIKFVTGGIKMFDLSEFGFVSFLGHVDNEIVDFTNKCAEKQEIKETKIHNKEFSRFTTSTISYQKQDVYEDAKILPLEVSRGCVFRCKFCAFPLNGKKKGEWIKDYSILYNELLYNYETYNITDYQFSDDTYNDSTQKITDIYEKVISKLPFKLTFTAYIRLDLVYSFPHTAQLLKDSGLRTAICGIETLDPVAAKLIGKGMNPQKLVDFATELKQDLWKDINMSSCWIIGFPSEKKESITNFVDWILNGDCPFDSTDVQRLKLWPGYVKPFKLYQSELDVSFPIHNYDIYEDDDGKVFYENKNTGVNSKFLDELVHMYHLERHNRKREKFGFFNTGPLNELGISQEDLKTKSIGEIFKKYDFNELKKQQKLKYYKWLMSLKI